MADFYLKLTLKEIPRLLSLLDRCEISPTYGCFDRAYWKYNIKDYFNARFQEAAYTLALIYNYKSPENRFYKNEDIKKLSIAACRFWAKRQNRNGSFNEYISFENSHVATAFSALAVASSYQLWGINDATILNALKKAAKWLDRNDDLIVINHDAGTIPFFYLMYRITKDRSYFVCLDKKLDKVLAHQNEEGWFEEYGGADIGYQSYSIYFLAKYYEMSHDKRVLGPLDKAVKFFSYFVHPDGTMGGFYGSRDTNFIIPAGFEILAGKINYAEEIAAEIRKSLNSMRTPGPYSFDDRFLVEELYIYLDFVENGLKIKLMLPIQGKDFRVIFDNCGLMVVKLKDSYLISNLKKDGIGLLFKDNKLKEVLGSFAIKKGRSILATYGKSDFVNNGQNINVKGNFYKYKIMNLKPIQNILLRLFNFVGLGKLVKIMIRSVLILKSNKTQYVFELLISLNNMQVKEIIDGRIKAKVKKIKDFSPIYSTSTDMFTD